MAAVLQRLRRPLLVTEYRHDLRLFRTRFQQVAVVVGLLLFVFLPIQLTDYPINVLNFAGIAAIGAIGLNLLTGYTGQVSLGHAFFIGLGSYVWAHFGGDQKMSLLVWLPLAAVMGGAIGAIVGPFALRLKGNYLAIVSLGLVFIGEHVWNNFESVTGGLTGISGDHAATIGPVDFSDLTIFGRSFSTDESYFYLIWGLVILGALIAKNIVRSRPGRAMQAVRDRDVAAAVIGVNLARYKVAAFAISGAYAAVAGAVYGSYVTYVQSAQWNLLLSIQYIAIIIVGGVGTIFGSILGALFLGGSPRLVEEWAPKFGFITDFLKIETAVLNLLIFGIVIVLFLVLEPRGMAGIWFRLKAYFKTWPFSY